MKKNHEIREVRIHDSEGNLMDKIIYPLKLELRDIVTQIIGASILAIPVGFTEETWKIGESIPSLNALAFVILSLAFISIFIYYNYYKHYKIKNKYKELIKRTISTYLVSILIVAIILSLIGVAPWNSDFAIAFKRTIIVAFPASMSAAIADIIK
jgi:uncharacterized membrane protein